jgi:hypothetical protein
VRGTLLRQVLEGRRRALGSRNVDTLTAMDNLSTLLIARGELREPEALLREFIAGRDALLRAGGGAGAGAGADADAAALTACHELGALLYQRRQLPEAEEQFRRAAGGRRALLGAAHLDTLAALNSLGACLCACACVVLCARAV